jgi:L-malate glycosyltransferase
MASIHFYSDCPFFAGCEFMLANFFNSTSLRKEHNISFTFRENLVYEQGFRDRVRLPVDASHVRLYDIYDWYAKADRFQPVFLRKILKIILNLALLKYFFIVINTVILYRVFRKRAKRGQIDILHINNGGYPGAYSSISAVLAADMAGIGTIVYVVNNITAGYRYPGRLLDYPFDILVRRRVSVFVTGSRYAGRALRKTLSLPEERVVTINNGIAVQPVTETREQVADRYHFPRGRVIIAVIANLEERKGHIFLLRALRKMKESGQPGRMPFLAIVAGPGDVRNILVEYILKNNLGEDVAFYPFEPRLSNLLNAVDIVVLPSISLEDFPNIVLDAMAAGKAVLASRFSGIQEQITDEESGLLVPPGDSDAIAAALVTLCGDVNFRKRLGDAARKSFSNRFTVEKSVNSYLGLYARLLSGNDPV